MDEDNKPWLLEVNSRPSLSISHEDEIGTTDLKNKMHISETDLKIKQPVVYDSLRLAMMKPDKAYEYDEFGIYERIDVEEDDEGLLR